ncbi:9076_t:CDS:2 [Diversispora eburnea]|uniref:9076_t:CDS:1 n=1 Tax=Diversispora eburnea TaxID=1213867 RepID=A0A9N8VZ02_9GLOM|nr:9076_t:CDS:2 [Diversispora eburnea]
MSSIIQNKIAPWNSILKSVIMKYKMESFRIPSMQLSTINHITQRPANRNVIFRGFVGGNKDQDFDLLDDKKLQEYLKDLIQTSSIILNSKLENDLLVIATDIRSNKVLQLKNDPGCELCWWFPETGDQFRLSGNAYILSSPSNNNDDFPFSMLSSYLNSYSSIPFDWEQERLKIWCNLLPEIRSSFIRPPPGKDKNEKELIKNALENFALVIFNIDFVDRVQLNIEKRTTWEFREKEGNKWTEVDVYP